MWLQEEDSALAVLHAAIDRIIPPDDFSGAREAGAGAYIRRQLTANLRLRRVLRMMRAGDDRNAGNWRHGWQLCMRAALQLTREDR